MDEFCQNQFCRTDPSSHPLRLLKDNLSGGGWLVGWAGAGDGDGGWGWGGGGGGGGYGYFLFATAFPLQQFPLHLKLFFILGPPRTARGTVHFLKIATSNSPIF